MDQETIDRRRALALRRVKDQSELWVQFFETLTKFVFEVQQSPLTPKEKLKLLESHIRYVQEKNAFEELKSWIRES
jgi:hypothetical protein